MLAAEKTYTHFNAHFLGLSGLAGCRQRSPRLNISRLLDWNGTIYRMYVFSSIKAEFSCRINGFFLCATVYVSVCSTLSIELEDAVGCRKVY